MMIAQHLYEGVEIGPEDRLALLLTCARTRFGWVKQRWATCVSLLMVIRANYLPEKAVIIVERKMRRTRTKRSDLRMWRARRIRWPNILGLKN